MARSIAEHQPRGINISRRRVLQGLGLLGVAVVAGESGRRVLFSESGGNEDPHPPGRDFLIPYDEGSFSLSPDQREILGRVYPEVPGELKLHFLGSYETPGGVHGLGVYNTSLPVDQESVDIIRQHADVFAGNAHLLEGQTYNGVRFSGQARPKVPSLQLTIPSHFPLPGEEPPRSPTTRIEWKQVQDDVTGASVSVVRTPDLGEAEKLSHALYLGDTINATSAARSLELTVPGGQRRLQPEEEKAIYEALGDAAVARSAGATYEEYVGRMRQRRYPWVAPEAMFDAIPSLPPVFFI
jgi:hypothetical protein